MKNTKSNFSNQKNSKKMFAINISLLELGLSLYSYFAKFKVALNNIL